MKSFKTCTMSAKSDVQDQRHHRPYSQMAMSSYCWPCCIRVSANTASTEFVSRKVDAIPRVYVCLFEIYPPPKPAGLAEHRPVPVLAGGAWDESTSQALSECRPLHLRLSSALSSLQTLNVDGITIHAFILHPQSKSTLLEQPLGTKTSDLLLCSLRLALLN